MGECQWRADARVYRQHIARWIAFAEQPVPRGKREAMKREAMHDLGVALLARMPDPDPPDWQALAKRQAVALHLVDVILDQWSRGVVQGWYDSPGDWVNNFSDLHYRIADVLNADADPEAR